MKSTTTLASAHRPLVWLRGAFGMLLSLGALTLAPLPAKAAAADGSVADCNWHGSAAPASTVDTVAAIDRYSDIPAPVRERLKQRMRDRNFDEFVTISRDAISGRNKYDARISDMQLGNGQVCRQVSRSGWSAEMKERGLVYCEQGHCILVSSNSASVSRISPTPTTASAGQAGGGVPDRSAASGEVPGSALPTAATPSDELRPGSGSSSLDGSAPSTVSGAAAPLPGFVPNAGFGPVATAAGGSPIFSGSPGAAARSTPQTNAQNPMSPVPEPETWGMMLAGLAGVAFAARRKLNA